MKPIRILLKQASVWLAISFLRARKATGPQTVLRIVHSTSAFFGHLALEPENYLSVKESGSPSSWAFNDQHARSRSRDWWTLGKTSTSPNPTLARAWRHHISVPPSWWVDALIRAGERFPRLALPQVHASLFGVGNALDKTMSHLELSRFQVRRAQRELEAIGIDLHKPYVALIVRDEHYFDKVGKNLSDGRMRNRSVSDFIPAVEALADLGLQVIRLGHLVASSLEVKHPLVFDYAMSGRRSELLDIFIPLTAIATISTLTGSDAVALVGRRPVLYVDIPLYAQVFHSTSCATWIPAQLRYSRTGEMLNLVDAFAVGAGWFVAPKQFEALGIEVVRSSPTDIAQYVVDFVSQVSRHGAYVGTSTIQELMQAALTKAMGDQGSAMHGKVHSRIAEGFIAKHPEFLADPRFSSGSQNDVR